MFAAVERLTVAVDAREWIHRLRCIVAIYAGLGGSSSFQPVAAVEQPVSEQRSDFPPIDVLAAARDVLLKFFFSVFHAQPDLKLVGQRKILEFEGPAGADADAREFLANGAFLRSRRCKLQSEIEIFEEVLLHQFR